MTTAKLARVAIVATLTAGSPTLCFAQAAPAAEQDAQPGYSEVMPGAMMGGRRYGMMGGMRPNMMPGHMMKIMFVIADVDGDGALSFEEVTTIHKRIFDKVDANKDAKVTPEEMQAFIRDQ
ncbi:hypothetical protein BLJAPNOD_05664 [Ensifer sp. M14]|uniref:EF-hand domain-containing protein n=1 Tax=Sinorhizobium/Ensifer group TaxID=227292 RepID=UPI000985B7EC|nr:MULTISPECIES: EF-hand domain-containing protein [Sinorhizobium/Ensifer group]RDL47568.1 hypothetical protein BLJAPNOD_05664 [Ensifer sp. M14]